MSYDLFDAARIEAGGAFAARHVFTGDSVGGVWADALLSLYDGPWGPRSPVVLSVDGSGESGGDAPIRAALDTYLCGQSETAVQAVAQTIFPATLWTLAEGDRALFFERYRRDYPRFAHADRRNRRGIYFGRLVAFDHDPLRGTPRPGRSTPCGGNQLEFILAQHGRRGGVRRSMYQAAVFDPTQDHSATAQLGFPCLQHVTFVPEGGVLHTNAFYATQQLVRKGYGNLLGLGWLGAFMAGEMGLAPGRLTVMVGSEKVGDATKGSYAALVAAVRAAR